MTRNVVRAWVVAAAGLLGGCLTNEQMAPPVGELLAGPETRAGLDVAQLERGRDVYLRKCSDCHTIEPIAGYTLEDWHDLLPEMMDEAELDADQRVDLRAYIDAAWRHMRASVTAGGSP